MKKQYFIFLVVACMLAISNIKAQSTPIDDFLKKFTSREGVTNVAMSQQMLQSIFVRPQNPQENPHTNNLWMTYKELNVPEAYSSVSISKTDIPENLFTDFKKTLLSSKYEQFMEVNKENSNILGYYLKKVKDNTNEIVILRQQKDQFSAIYIRGVIEMRQVDDYLRVIKLSLARMGATNHPGMFQPDLQLALTMPVLDDLRIDLPNLQEFNFQFDHDALKLRMEESMKDVRDQMKNWKFEYNEDMQQNIQDVIENAKKLAEDARQKAMEEAQKQMEDAVKQAEEEQTESL